MGIIPSKPTDLDTSTKNIISAIDGLAKALERHDNNHGVGLSENGRRSYDAMVRSFAQFELRVESWKQCDEPKTELRASLG